MTVHRKKLIEVSLPLKAINAASAREKSIRHGHPSTLHLWWARRPLAACRAVLFAQLVDDPSGWPEEFPTEEAQARERKRLHGIIEEMVPWKATHDERIIGKARYEIARSLARELGDAPPDENDARAVLEYLAQHAPPVCDPFCGGGSIPLEAQRLGLRAHGSDLNPVAVLVSKATCEIPPKFSGAAPVHPDVDRTGGWRGASGLAEDIRRYGKWMRDKAEARIGHLYPTIRVTEAMADDRDDLRPYTGKDLTVIAWLWARTVASPDPMMRGTHVPLASSFVLSSKKSRQAIIVPVVNREARTYRFVVRSSGIGPEEYVRARKGTKAGRGANFNCLVSGAPISGDYIKAEGKAGRMRARLMAVVAEGKRTRLYLDPTEEMAEAARQAEPEWRPAATISGSNQYLGVRPYGMDQFDELFTDRQLVALTTFSDLVAEARQRVLADALLAEMDRQASSLADGGDGAEAYADAIATYLALVIGKAADLGNSLCAWEPNAQCPRHLFSRQAIPMVWDFAEPNPFSSSSGGWVVFLQGITSSLEKCFPLSGLTPASIEQRECADGHALTGPIFTTDPPYYDNVPYADISDFFYVWLRRTLPNTWPDLFRRLLTPKAEELVAFAYRHGGKDAAERFFIKGMGRALRNMQRAGAVEFPVTLYYAFKQAEVAKEGLTSPGWATFLQAVFEGGYVVDGTWPVRTENASRMRGQGSNALASSIVMVCRKRSDDAVAITRREFVARLRAKLPDALKKIREGGVGPVDMAQASIGPGMGIFTAASNVLEPDDTPMTVRAAIALINQVRDEISGEEASGYDPETRFCIDWFEAFGMEEGTSGEAINMAQGYDIGIDALQKAGVVRAHGGKTRLLRREEMPEDWSPGTDKRLTDWECAQHLARVMESRDGGMDAAARLYSTMGSERSDNARMLAYRLYDICERTNRAAEAQVWNALAQEWPALDAALIRFEEESGRGPSDSQGSLGHGLPGWDE
ncbi:MAG: DUF1156 domain-containing protein [Gemmatimonadales bacterium]|nr:DUF1156 domain-containing protein [Gemmatimonadales bacterium]MYC89071.1 DUF1156 domain-containing protein [Candidatus Palauibacter denitrificans]